MKKLIYSLVAVTIVTLTYFFFEPIFIYNVGWKNLPANTFTSPDFKLTSDSSFGASISESEKILTEAHTTLKAPAISVAVGVAGKIVYAKARGYKDIDNSDIADINTSFRVGSTSKAITSVVLGTLLERDKLHLDAPVQNYVSYLSIQKPITIRQLASHQSGIRDYSTCLCFPVWEYYSNDQYNTIKEGVDVFQDDELLFVPGDEYSYSSYNFTLLSAAIEEAAGTPFLTYTDKALFNPLKMDHTSADYADQIINHRATFYEIKDGQYKEAFPINNSNKWAGGGFISTPSDLVKLGNALLNGQILSRETTDILFTPQKLNDGSINEEGYALGWRSSKEQKILNGEKTTFVVHHGGVAMGSTSFFILFPDYNLVVSMLMNRNKPAEFREFSQYAFLIAEPFIREIEKQKGL